MSARVVVRKSVLATNCLACGKKLRAPDEATLYYRAARHERNCPQRKQEPKP